MRPRAIQSVPGLNPEGTPFERFREFAWRIVSVPKEEADRREGEIEHEAEAESLQWQ